MAISVCPADEIDAPVAVVWSLVDRPERFDAWWDARVIDATPPGPMAPGQHVVARARGAFPARITFDVVAVDAAQHRLELVARLPFHVIDHMTIVIQEIARDRSLVRFG